MQKTYEKTTFREYKRIWTEHDKNAVLANFARDVMYNNPKVIKRKGRTITVYFEINMISVPNMYTQRILYKLPKKYEKLLNTKKEGGK